jgi:small-conductance mechanosensitive channel
MIDLLETEIAANSIQTWMIAVAIAAVVLCLAGLMNYFFIRHLKKKADDNETDVIDIVLAVVRRTSWLFILLIALFAGSLVMELADRPRHIANSAMIIALLIQAGMWASAALKVSVELYRKRQFGRDPASVTTLNILNFIGKVALWAIVLVLVMDNLGINITALVAGLGVGGIAIALAVQTILGDLFASLSIVLDKPFVVGDFLMVGDMLGSVEHVGLKTTRVRSLSGEQLVFSNSDLLNSRIRNFGRMYERRVPFNLGVTYQTPRDKLKLIPEIIHQAVEQQENTRFDRSHFKEYGSHALTFESVYYVIGPDYNTYMDIQQAINLFIHERFEQEGIEFAYPTQTIFMQKA